MWQSTEIVDPAQFTMATMPLGPDFPHTVVRILYTYSGRGLLALGSDGVQRFLKWTRGGQNPSGLATVNVIPERWQAGSGPGMTNVVSEVNLEGVVPCIAVSKNDTWGIAAACGKLSLFNLRTFNAVETVKESRPSYTYLAFYPHDNNIIAIGMEDSTIFLYNVRSNEVKSELIGHLDRITGLAFSTTLNILVSSGADALLCVWRLETWENLESIALELPAGETPNGDTGVQFHPDQTQLLVCHETQLAIYDASNMKRIRQWLPQGVLSANLSNAVYSSGGELLYASFCDGNIGVFDANTLALRCRIAPSAYLWPAVLNENEAVPPVVLAANPRKLNQFAIALTDGSVKLIEPAESEGCWGIPILENGW